MKKLFQFLGTVCLSLAAIITIVGPASLSNIAVEEMPESMKNQR
jgi:hypothetical protein